jgi:hypothetical protein
MLPIVLRGTLCKYRHCNFSFCPATAPGIFFVLRIGAVELIDYFGNAAPFLLRLFPSAAAAVHVTAGSRSTHARRSLAKIRVRRPRLTARRSPD